MKRFISTLAVLGVALMPLTAMAATLVSGQQYSLPAQKIVEGNLYSAAGTSTIGGRVTGDVLAVGGTISLAGSVGGDVFAIGGTLQVLGPVGGDVRVAGGTLSINDRVGGDLVVAGGTVHVLPGAIVQGDLIVAAGQVIVDGTVQGSVRMTGEELVINGAVYGDVRYRSQNQLQKGESAVIGGKVLRTAVSPSRTSLQASEGAFKGAFWAIVGVMTGMALLAGLGLVALLMWRWRRQSLGIIAQARDEFWPSLGRGITYGILVPIAAILLLISFVGAFPGALLLLIYIAALILTKALAGMLFGSWLIMVMKKRQVMHLTWVSALGGFIVLRIVAMIPVVGWIISIAASLVVFGVVAHRIQKQLSSR
ncbi:MAG: polymer-forming cytoskeletal protein [Patescibacteria group bacterium]